MHERLTSEAQILLRFALGPLDFEIQNRQKIRNAPNDPKSLDHLTVKSTLHTLNTYYPRVSLYD